MSTGNTEKIPIHPKQAYALSYILIWYYRVASASDDDVSPNTPTAADEIWLEYGS